MFAGGLRRAWVLLLVAIVAAGITAATAQAKVPRGITVPLPAPPAGEVALGRVEVRAVARAGHRIPARLKLGITRMGRLTGNIVIFEGTGVARRKAREVDFDVLFTLIRSRTAVRTAHIADDRNPLEYIYDFVTKLYGGLRSVDLSHSRVRERTLNDLFTGSVEDRIDMFKPDAPGDRSPGDEIPLDTGHYDDGHSFGWTRNTPPKIMADSWGKLATGQFAQETLDGIIRDIETDLNDRVKLDGASTSTTPSPCTGTGTTASQTLTDPSPQAQVAVYDFTTSIPATCDITADTHVAIYVINDSDGSVIACRQDLSAGGAPPPPGQSTCPQGSVSGPLPGDPSSSVMVQGAMRAQGATVWHIPIEVQYGMGGGQASVHLVYSWVPLA
jgi:hypothetical protein